MEKYSKWRDPSTGVAPFLYPLSPATTTLPPIARFVTLPLTTTVGAVRTLLLVLLVLAQTILVEGVLSLLSIYPPVYRPIARACNASICRLILVVFGIFSIPVETILLRKTGRSPPQAAFEPKQGDVIVANSSSYLDLFYLAFRHNVTFLLPVIDSSDKVTGWKRVSLIRALWTNGRIPERSVASASGETLEVAIKNARGPVVVFPECTTSNNRALLKFPSLSPTSLRVAPGSRIFVLTFKYCQPTRFTPSLTHPIPAHSPFLGPLPHLFSVLSTLTIHSFSIRRLHPTESPKSLEGTENGQNLEDVVATTGRFKKLGGLGWIEKRAFLEFRRIKGR
ncbi:lysophosphatidic acid acyltransferase LOA1 [Sporobolomyces koalae]|uniref:lysophosphatidic acid acyltransferase LOA1 n=1 Tax=Sporobolomyces koalae TaxID=500713 RepID=UPI0031817251